MGTLGSRDGAEDVVQDAAILAWSRVARFTRGTDFRAWMATFVRHTAMNHRRSKARRRKHERASAPHDFDMQTPTASHEEATTGLALAAAERIDVPGIDAKYQHALASLSQVQRSCFLLRAIAG
ncbi:MAG: sigma factor, partial [Planctomycetota bacterium]